MGLLVGIPLVARSSTLGLGRCRISFNALGGGRRRVFSF